MTSLKKQRERKMRKRRAPVRSPADFTRNISSATASPSRSRAAADDIADTSGSVSGSSYAPNADGGPEPGGTAGTGLHAGGASDLGPYGAAGPQGMESGKAGLQSLLPERAGPLLRALTNTEGHAASGAPLSHLHAGMQVAWRRVAATRCQCLRSGTTEQ